MTGAAGVGALTAMGGLAGCGPSSQSVAATEGEGGTIVSPDSWLESAPDIADEDCEEIVDTEVLVVGAGCSGWFAACHAADAGVKVLLIEAGEKCIAIRSSALGAVGSKKQIAAGVEIDKEDIVNDITSYALNQNNMALVRQWADNSAEAIDWYCDLIEANGFTVQLESSMPQGTRYRMWPTGHGTVEEEQDVIVVVEAYLTDAGGVYRNKTRMQCLITENDRVVGIYATNADGDNIRINASKGVIIATGGYVSNPDMYKALQGELEKSLSGFLSFGTAVGDGIKACLWAGAKMDDISTTMIFDRGVIKPETELAGPWETEDMAFFTYATQPFLKVNKAGQRICNESSPYDYIVHAAANMPGRAWYPIWDSKWKEDVQRFYTIGCSTLFSREGSNHHPPGLDVVEGQMNEMIESGHIIKADTIEQLASGLKLDDPALFSNEVEKCNDWFSAGYDAEYGKDPFRLSSIDQGPFYGMKVGGLALCTLDGIRVNTDYQALDENAEPIEGLYVIGNDSGGYYAHTYPNFGAGTNAGRCATAGMLCGRIVAAN